MSDSFIKNQRILEEDYRVDDLLNLSEAIESFSIQVDSYDTQVILGFVGGFGKGKSTFLYNVKSKRAGSHPKEKWIDFDAWQFPERRDLWEGFILGFAKQLGKFQEVKKVVDGETSSIWFKILKNIHEIPALSAIKFFTSFLKDSPIKRVFQLQELLKQIINKSDFQTFVVVIEDIDRSGDAGVYFLETLKHFLKQEPDLKKKIVTIVPIGSEKFEQNKNSYSKCLDYIEFFENYHIKLDVFIKEVMENDYLNQVDKEIITLFLEYLINNQGLTIRDIKMILRNADGHFKIFQEKGFTPCHLVSIILETSKFIKTPDSTFSYFEDFKRKGVVYRGTLFSRALFAVFKDTAGQKLELDAERDFNIVKVELKKQSSSLWRSTTQSSEEKWYLAGFYFD